MEGVRGGWKGYGGKRVRYGGWRGYGEGVWEGTGVEGVPGKWYGVEGVWEKGHVGGWRGYGVDGRGGVVGVRGRVRGKWRGVVEGGTGWMEGVGW